MEPEAGCNCGPTWCPEPVKNHLSEGKNFWPELVGENGEVAATTIQRENCNVRTIIIIRPGDGMQQDLRSDRVFVLVDPNDVVICAPSIG